MMGFIDNLMIGDLGYIPLSASALANGMFFIIVILGMGITMALSPLVAEANAGGKWEKCGQYLRNGVWVGIWSSVLLGALVYLSAYLLPYMDQPAEDVALAQPYLRILSWSVLPMLLFLSFKQFTDGLSLTRPAMYITLAGLAFNTLANWLLIYGHLGFPRWELNGAGIGTLSSRIFMMLLMAGYVFHTPRFGLYSVKKYWHTLQWSCVKKILAIGLPSGLIHFFEVAAFVGAAILVGKLGSAERAAHQIAIQLASLSFMVVTGVSAGAAIRVGNALGRKDWPNVQQAGAAGIGLSIFIMAVSAIVFLLGKQVLPSLFVEDPKVLALAANLMVIAAFFQLFDGIQAVGVGILRGIQDVKMPMAITFIAYWLIAGPLGYGLTFSLGYGIYGMWYAFVVSLGFAAVMLTLRFFWLTKKHIQRPGPAETPKPELVR